MSTLTRKIWCFPIWVCWVCARGVLNAWGYVRGRGGCKCCGDRWSWKTRHTTRYTFLIPGASVLRTQAPLCNECWAALLPNQRLEMYRNHCSELEEKKEFSFSKEWKALARTVLEEK